MMKRKMRFIIMGMFLSFVALFVYACEGRTSEDATSYISFYMGVSGIDHLYPDSIVFRSADGLDSVVAVGSDTIDSASGKEGWYSSVGYAITRVPFAGDGYISFTIDSVHFEIPSYFNTGYCRIVNIKIGGDNALFGLTKGDSYPLPTGLAGVDSIYYWAWEHVVVGSAISDRPKSGVGTEE